MQDIIKSNFLQPSKDGVISHDDIISYQTAIDDLLRVARSSKPSEVLFTMQKVVLTCKRMTESVDDHEARGVLSSSDQSSLYSLKSQFSASLTQLLNAAKNHANSMGVSPVSLVDAAAGHLTSVVADLAKLLGMSPGKTRGMAEDDRGDDMLKPTLNGTTGRTTPKKDSGDTLEPQELAVSWIMGSF